MGNSKATADHFLSIGHRGAMGHATENTLASIRKAMELGVDGVEIDVRYIDGRLLVIHDDRLERTTNGSGLLSQHTFGALRRLDAGNGERIPTLDEVCALIDGRCGLNIELKQKATAAPVMEFVARLRDEGWDDDLLLISSFYHDELERLRQLDERINIGVLVERARTVDIEFACAIRAHSIHPSQSAVTASWVSLARQKGLKVYVYTVNEPEALKRLMCLGVDGVFSNYPERVNACLSRTGSDTRRRFIMHRSAESEE